jgi:hypothetical protein
MRGSTVAGAAVLAMILFPSGAGAERTRIGGASVSCVLGSHTLLASSQAQVYAARKGPLRYLSLRGCAYEQRRSFFVAACGSEESATTCAERSHVSLAGSAVAAENSFVPECGCAAEGDIAEWEIVVRNLRTGRVLHDVPTGTPLRPKPRYIGVGAVVGLVLNDDGSVAWIAQDYERSATPHGTGVPYFDVYASDETGTRLLASGTNIDPSSLALSAGDFGVSGMSRTVYWMQGGKSESATLE